MRVIHSAQFELSVDGVPRSYRDRKGLALESAQILKSRNPNSVVRVCPGTSSGITKFSEHEAD